MRVLTNLSVSGTTTSSDATALTHVPTTRQMPGGLGFGAIEFYGHSMTSFGGSLTVDRGIATRLGSMLHADTRDFTINGADLTNHDKGVPFSGTYLGDGGWAHTYTFASPEAHGAPYEPRRDGAVIFTGINDLVALGTTNLTNPFKNALRASISRLRASAVFEDSDASVAYSTAGGHTWTNNVAGGTLPEVYTSGTTYSKTTTTGATTVTISVPSDFPGGTVVFASLCGPTGQGGSFSFTVDAVSAGTLTASGVQPKNVTTNTDRLFWTPVIKRFTGLSAGAHTIVASVTAVSTEAYFDCWWIEAASPPLINVPLAPYTDGAGGHSVDADVDTMDALITSVVGEFDSSVFSTDLRSVTNKTTDLYDGEHFNDQGMKKVAAKWAEDFLIRSRTTTQHAEGNADQHFISRFPSQGWDNSTPLNNLVNVIQPTRPNVIPLTIRQSKYGDRAAESPKKDLLRIEDNTATIMSGIDYLGRIYAGTGTGMARMSSILGIAIMDFGNAQIAGSTDTLALKGGDNTLPQVKILSGSAATDDLLQIFNFTTKKVIVNKDGSVRTYNGGLGVSQFATYTNFTDANPVYAVIAGTLNFGAGGASATDLTVYRGAAGQFRVGGTTVIDSGLTVTSGGATVTAGGLTVTAGGALVSAGALDLRSGASGTKQSITLGRTGSESEIGTPGATNDIITGSGAGDLIMNLASSGNTIKLAVGGTAILTLSALGTTGAGSFTAGGNLSSGGDIKATAVGKGLYVKEGTNAAMGTATLVATAGGSVVTVNTSKVTTTSRIQLTIQTPGGTVGFVYVNTRTASTSFQIKSSSATDTSVVAWMIIEPS